MRGTLVNLNVNPCKMCMPMGVAMAVYGIKNSMTILHGSQGCSTYIRRHMATHYNEPIDIASTSLTEEGTVYGGEKNLLIGLENVIKVYQPEVIAVATTCLAETIGEDIERTIDIFYKEKPEYRNIRIIPIPSAGYAGTQFAGYWNSLYQIVSKVSMDRKRNGKVNVVTGMITPADTRYLKELLESFSIDYILLPDSSENLDEGFKKDYQRLPSHGTDIKDIEKMAGARITLELSCEQAMTPSVAEYLSITYGVPFVRLNLPVCLRDNDKLLSVLSKVSVKKIPEKQVNARARYLDAMIDSHKYNAEARIAVFGEPDFLYSIIRLCTENGIFPSLMASGTKCGKLKEAIENEIQEIEKNDDKDSCIFLEDTDFQTIEEEIRKRNITIMIGNSDGRRIAKKLNLELIRRGFPVHDRVGGQRLRMLGYEGSLALLDEITNVILSKKESGFRDELYQKYYKEESRELSIEDRTATHPCFNCGAHDYARMHLPIAPKCNISCNYCVRKFDCPNESRPGVTTKVLSPEEAFEKYMEVKKKVPNLSVIGIAGPGDALANFEETKRTLELIRKQDKQITFCLSTNGLMLPQYALDLIELGVTHVTVTMNCIDPKIGGKIYKYINYMGVNYYGESAAAILMSNQMAGIKMLTLRGIVCKVNIVMLKGINDQHIPEVVSRVKELGGTITNIMQLIPVQGSVFENLPLVSNQEILSMRKQCGETMKQMYHCRQCRADAVGTLDHDQSIEFNACHQTNKIRQDIKAEMLIEQQEDKEAAKVKKLNTLQFAIATKSGIIVDQHFGHVTEFYVYEYSNGNPVFKEKRTIDRYCSGIEECGTEEDKIEKIIHTISDCNAVITMRIGESPKNKLNQIGIRVFTTYDRIEDSVRKAASELMNL